MSVGKDRGRYKQPAKLRMKLSGTLFSSLSMPRPNKTRELPIRVKMAMAHKIIRISVRFSKFSVEDKPVSGFPEFVTSAQNVLIQSYSTVSVWSAFRDGRDVTAILEPNKVPISVQSSN